MRSGCSPCSIKPLDQVLDRADELDRAEAEPGLGVLGMGLEDRVEGFLAPGEVARDQVLLGDGAFLGGRGPSHGERGEQGEGEGGAHVGGFQIEGGDGDSHADIPRNNTRARLTVHHAI